MVRKVKAKKGIVPSFQLTSRTPMIEGAPCQDNVDPEIFFPDPTDREGIKIAKDLCGSCNQEVRVKCLTFAIENKINYGVWGGMTEAERTSIRRKSQRSAL